VHVGSCHEKCLNIGTSVNQTCEPGEEAHGLRRRAQRGSLFESLKVLRFSYELRDLRELGIVCQGINRGQG
jgi:hypothetical protein